MGLSALSNRHRKILIMLSIAVLPSLMFYQTRFSSAGTSMRRVGSLDGAPESKTPNLARFQSLEPPDAIFNPDICEQWNSNRSPQDDSSGAGINKRRPLLLVIAVVSAHHHRDRRDAIRETWGSATTLTGSDFIARPVFVIGLAAEVPSLKGHQDLEDERAEHGDILRGNFRDVYANLTAKTMTILEWFESRCETADFLLKIDDDCFLNVDLLRSLITSGLIPPSKTKMGIYGRVLTGMEPHRNLRSKWFVGTEEYPLEWYPAFATGPAYLVAASAVTPLLTAARGATYLHLEDVYLTGIVAEAAGVPRVDVYNFVGSFPGIYGNGAKIPCLAAKSHVTLHGVGSAAAMRATWRSASTNGVSCHPNRTWPKVRLQKMMNEDQKKI